MVAGTELPTPKILYRYRHLEGRHREWTARIITESVLHFASPTTFNDPFDCKVHFRFTSTMEQLKRKHNALLKKYVPSMSRAERRAKASQDLKRLDREQFLKAMTTGLQTEVDKTGVLSLSKYRESVVLWSHYAASHSGICLGFSVDADAAFFARAQPVDYAVEYPTIEMLGDTPDKHVEGFLLTKALGWKYEEEWRIIDHDTGSGDKVFLEQALTEVVLGARISPDDRQFVLECLKRRKHPVSVFEASANPGTYALDIKPYEF